MSRGSCARGCESHRRGCPPREFVLTVRTSDLAILGRESLCDSTATDGYPMHAPVAAILPPLGNHACLSAMILKPVWFFAFCTAAVLHADDPVAKLDTMTREFVDLGLFRGSVLVVQGDRILLDRGYGPADAEHGVANAPTTRFRIGSITKWFTRVAIMDLAAEGRLALDEPIAKFVPEAPSTWAPIRVSHLLMHEAGLANYTDLPEFHEYSSRALTPVALLELFKDRPLAFSPGAKFDYSNANYILLGLAIERVTGEDYGAYMQRRYFTPFGLKDTEYPQTAESAQRTAIGYHPTASGPAPAPSWHLSTAYAAGGLVATTADLHRWFEATAAGRVGEPEGWATLKSPWVDYREGGLSTASANGRKILTTSGAISGFMSHLVYDTTSGTLIIVLANIGGAGAEDLTKNLLGIVQGQDPQLPSAKTGIVVAAETLAGYACT